MQLYPRESHVPVYPSLSLLEGESLRHCGCCLSALRTIAYAKSLQTASKIAEVAQMGSQNLLALTSRRAQISECLQMLEARPPVREARLHSSCYEGSEISSNGWTSA